MLPEDIRKSLAEKLAGSEHPREHVIDVVLAIQRHYGYLSDQGVEIAAALLNMTPLQIEELATFYTFIYREPVGKYVIHVCDSVICWMNGYEKLASHLARKLGIHIGGTTPDGLFTLLPVCCIGYCDRSPAMLVNGKAYGPLTPESIDDILTEFREGDGRAENSKQ